MKTLSNQNNALKNELGNLERERERLLEDLNGIGQKINSKEQ